MLTVEFMETNIRALRYIIQNQYPIKGVHFHSQSIQPNGLFFALTTGNRDGHEFIDSAIENGATTIILSDLNKVDMQPTINYIVVEDTYKAMVELAKAHRNNLMVPIIGITGSNGKTTTKDMVYHLLSTHYHVYKTEGNLNNHIGVPLSLLNMNDRHDYGVLELGMNQLGEIDYLAELVNPSISVITNVGESHIEYLKTTENIAKAKAEIIPHTSNEGFVVLPEGILHKEVFEQIAKPKTLRFISEKGEVGVMEVDNVTTYEDGTSMLINGREVGMPVKGMHNVQNAMLAVTVALACGISEEDVQKGLSALQITGMRYEEVKTPHTAKLINDAYNASPTSMKAAVQTFLNEQGGKILVLGDMYELGGLSKSKHEEVGHFLNAYEEQIEQLITVGVDASFIGQSFKGTTIHFDAHSDVVRYLLPFLKEEVSILFKASRGMKLENIIKELASL